MPEKTIAEEAGLGPEWVPLDAPPIVPGQPAPGQPSISSPPLIVGSLPPLFQHDVSFVATEIKSPNVPNLSLMPLGIQGNPSTNAGIQSSSTTVVQEVNNASSQVITFSTNGVANPDQEALNITAGSGISATAGAGGLVTIASTGDTDYYQTVKRNLTPFTQRPALNFSTDFTVGDSIPNNDTEIGITFPQQINLETNGTPNSSQSILNLTQSGSVTVTAGSSGLVTFAGPVFETNGTPNGSQSLLNLHAGTGATITDNGSGQITIAATGSTNPGIVQFYDVPFTGDVTIGTSPTSILAKATTAPSSGGPFRVMVSYSTYLDFTGFTNVNGFTLYVSDGTHLFASYTSGQSNASSGASTGATCCMFSPVTYANSSTPTFTLFGVVFTGGGAVAKQNSIQAGPGSDMQVTFFTSV